MSSCTTLDHCYPQNAANSSTAPGTPCYCGSRTWGGVPTPKLQRLRVGAVVRVANNTEQRSIVERVRDDGGYLYRVDGAPVNGRLLFERAELEVIR